VEFFSSLIFSSWERLRCKETKQVPYEQSNFLLARFLSRQLLILCIKRRGIAEAPLTGKLRGDKMNLNPPQSLGEFHLPVKEPSQPLFCYYDSKKSGK
jgi:hypothetical protein